ncbi:hypothetical protein WDA55_23645, partial [Acinetobacter baumannii]
MILLAISFLFPSSSNAQITFFGTLTNIVSILSSNGFLGLGIQNPHYPFYYHPLFFFFFLFIFSS